MGWVVSTETAALVPDVTQDFRFYNEVDSNSGFQTKSVLCVPLKTSEGDTIGVIELMNVSPNYLNNDGLNILGVIADHATLAIENAQLVAQTRQQAEEQALLFGATTIVTSALEMDTVLNAVSRQMVEALHADLCIISRLNKSENKLNSIYGYVTDLPHRFRATALDPPPATAFLRAVITTQNSALLTFNTRGIPDIAQQWLEQLDVKALFLIPLVYDKQTIGLVEVGRRQDVTMSNNPNELRLAETLAAQAAVSIEHARLYDELSRRLAQAQALQAVMVAAAAGLDFDQILNNTIATLQRTLHIERLGYFHLSQNNREMIAYPTTVGYNQAASNVRVSIKGSAVGWVYRKNCSLLLVGPDDERYPEYEFVGNTQSQVCAPINLNGQVSGVLNAESTKPNTFDREDEALFQSVAAQLSVALDNAHLFDEACEAEFNFHDLFENANDFIFSLDRNLQIMRANKIALKASGYDINEIIGMRAVQFVHPAQAGKLYKLLKEHLADQAPATFELTALSRDKTETSLEITMRVQRRPADQRPMALHFIARDITQRLKMENYIRQTEKLSSIGRLTAGVAHELNNPLTSIVGYADMLQKSEIEPAHKEDAQIIFRQAQRAQLIVKDLLTFARKVELEPEPIDINEVIHASLSLSKAQFRKHNIYVSTSLDFGLPQTVADPHRLEQVFINLITNAVHVLAKLPDSGKLTIKTGHKEDTITIRFADTGPGIQEDILPRIFEPFFSTKGVNEGTGLGLSICYGIISEHKGKIWAENIPAGGSVFIIELPIISVEKAIHTQRKTKPMPVISRQTPITSQQILVIDDEEYLLALLKRVLKQQGHTVDTAPNGYTAMQKLGHRPYNLIICDILMPDILGPQLYQDTIKQLPHLANKFIFITGNVVDKDTKTFLEETNLPWLAKPFLPADIENAITHALS